MKTQENLFKFLNKNKIRYVVLRGYRKENKEKGKDLDILILKKDYGKLKKMNPPEIDRVVDYYIDNENHHGVIFLNKKAIFRRKFNKELNFFTLSSIDYLRMLFFRKCLKIYWFFRRLLSKNKKMNSMDKKKVIKNNLKLFGFKYILWDIFYQIFRFIHKKIIVKNSIQAKKEDLIVKKINDYKMVINKNSEGIHRDLYLKSTREPISTKIMESILKKGDVVLDAGANIGYYVILESRKIGNKGLVYAVEPIKENFSFLKRNIKLNNLKNVKLYKFAFSDKSGIIKINVSNEGNLNTPAKIENPKRIDSVKSITLDKFFNNKKKPRVMRTDVDGFEHIIFKGGIKTLDHLEVIFVELHFPMVDKREMISLLNLFKNKGFEIHKAVLEWERSVEGNTILGKIVNYLHQKRSKPKIFNDLTINKLINSEFINGHLSLEVFLTKRK